MIDASALASPLAPTLLDQPVGEDAPKRSSGIIDDLRFFLLCYLAGLVVFLVMLS